MTRGARSTARHYGPRGWASRRSVCGSWRRNSLSRAFRWCSRPAGTALTSAASAGDDGRVQHADRRGKPALRRAARRVRAAVRAPLTGPARAVHPAQARDDRDAQGQEQSRAGRRGTSSASGSATRTTRTSKPSSNCRRPRPRTPQSTRRAGRGTEAERRRAIRSPSPRCSARTQRGHDEKLLFELGPASLADAPCRH